MATTLETVSSFYKNMLGRDASASETAYWVGRIDSGAQSVADVVTAFTVSAEAATNVAPIVELYFTAFGRAPDTAGLQYWISAKQNGMSLGQVTQANEFAQSAKPAAVGSPGIVEIIQSGVALVQGEILVA